MQRGSVHASLGPYLGGGAFEAGFELAQPGRAAHMANDEIDTGPKADEAEKGGKRIRMLRSD